MYKILIIDDEPNIHFAFRRAFEGEYDVLTANTAEHGFELVESEEPDVVILDIRLPGMDGLDAMERFQEKYPNVPVIVLTAFPSMRYTVLAASRGAFEFFSKPPDMKAMRETIARAVREAQRRRLEGEAAEETEYGEDSLIGSSPVMQEVYKQIGRVVNSDVTVLIVGESGTGKELVARAIHRFGPRRNRSYGAINCAAIPENLMESELFGHKRGAFTGAQHGSLGVFRQHDGGTVLLDEIAELPLPLQAKLLRFLQEGEFLPLGETTPVRVDVRIIASTNRDLEAAVEHGKFREDLYYRLNVFRIELPPLRERDGDIEELARFFLYRYSRKYGRRIETISPEAMALLNAYNWPGNVRELENTIARAVLLCPGRTIRPEHLRLSIETPAAPVAVEAAPKDPESLLIQGIDALLADPPQEELYPYVERILLARTLEHFAGNQTQAAKLLGIARNTLRSKMERYQLAKDVQIVREKPQEKPQPQEE